MSDDDDDWRPAIPYKLDERRIQRIVAGLTSAASPTVAYRYAGLNPETVRQWLRDARRLASSGKPIRRKSDQLLIKLLEAVEEAETEVEIRLSANVSKAASDGDWRAAAWMLPRRFPERWTEQTASKVEVTGKEGGPVQIESTGVLDVMAKFLERTQPQAADSSS